MDYHEHILRLLAELLLLALQHPIWAAAWACALVVLRYLAGGIGSATVSYLWTEYVLKRVLPPAPSPTEVVWEGRVEALSRDLGRAETQGDAARQDALRAWEVARAQRTRADRLDAALREAPRRSPRRRRSGARRRRGRGRC